jgi:hypothetical protein
MASSQHIVSPTLRLSLEVVADPFESDATVASYSCAICSKIGSEDYPDASIYVDGQGQYMRGAQLSPGHGWVCSTRCLSQLMYQSATPVQRAMLKRFELALVAIEETAQHLDPMLEEWGMEMQVYGLLDAIKRAHKDIGHSNQRGDNPQWIVDNEEPAEDLRRVVRHAVLMLDCKAIDELHANVVIETNTAKGSAFEARRSARIAASIGNVMARLNEAVAR